jgi:hypothetical protein
MTLSANDLVWYEKDGETGSGGYSLSSFFKDIGSSPIRTENGMMAMAGGAGGNGLDDTSKFSDLFRVMGIPAGLATGLEGELSGATKVGGATHVSNESVENMDVVSEGLYEKLLELAGPENSEDVKQAHDPEPEQAGGSIAKKQHSRTRKRHTRKSDSSKGKGKGKAKKHTRKNNHK